MVRNPGWFDISLGWFDISLGWGVEQCLSLCPAQWNAKYGTATWFPADLFAYRCNTLDACNEVIGQYGPEMSKGHDRITVKLRQGQQTAVTKNNISVASFSG